jgi:hypothetical protein
MIATYYEVCASYYKFFRQQEFLVLLIKIKKSIYYKSCPVILNVKKFDKMLIGLDVFTISGFLSFRLGYTV